MRGLLWRNTSNRCPLCGKFPTQIDKGTFEEIVVEVVYWGFARDATAKQAAEELFEIVGAILDDPEGVGVHIRS